MINKSPAYVCLFFLTFFLIGISVEVALGQSRNADQQYGAYLVKKLASKSFKGRGYGQGGDTKAAEFIAKAFQKTGVKPLLGDSYFQEFTLGANIFPKNVTVKLGGKTLRPGVDYLVWSGSPSIKGSFSVVHASHGQLYSNKSVDSLAHLAQDKFLLIDNSTTGAETPQQEALAKENLLKLRNDSTFKMRGIVIFSNNKLTHAAQTKQSIRPVLFVNDSELKPENLEEITVNIESKLLTNYVTRNVVGIVKGTEQPDSMIFITAHYDHLGTMGRKAIFFGANDNASGTAFMLSLAKYFAANPAKYTMVFIGFAGEESGLLGSKAFVENPPVSLSKIKFLLNFDMVGTGEEGITVVNAPMFPAAFATIQSLNEQKGYLSQVKSRGESCNSDHCPFYQKGVPSFFIYTMGGIAAYHDVFDQAKTLPLTKFSNLKQLIVDFISMQ